MEAIWTWDCAYIGGNQLITASGTQLRLWDLDTQKVCLFYKIRKVSINFYRIKNDFLIP